MKFPVIIKDGKSTITFTSNDHGTYESGAACMSTLEDMMVRVNSGKALIATTINAHNDLCDLAKAPQHLYAGEELDLTVCFNRKRFEQLQAQLTDFIYNK